MKLRRFPVWTALAAVLIVALVAGSGWLSSSPPTRAQRAYAIESVLRCPSCEDLSVAQSTAPTAVAVRAKVSQLLAQGRSDQQIENYLVDRYGSTILLDPPARGWPLLVWLVPLVGGVIAIAALAAVLVRRRAGSRRDAVDGPLDVEDLAPAAAAGRAGLEDRRQFLVRSLADADAEYLAGDLAEDDYLFLRRRDLVRLAAVERELEAAPATEPAAAETAPLAETVQRSESATLTETAELAETAQPTETAQPAGTDTPTHPIERGSTRRRWLVRGAVASFAAALLVTVSLFAAERLPGQTATGTVSLTQSERIAQTLDQAAMLENSGQLGQAATLYQSVLGGHPDNEVALAQLGWLEFQIGSKGANSSLMDDGESKLERATKLDSGDYAASLYLGTILLQRDGNAAGAVGQYQRFLADDPPAALLQQAAPELRQAYQQAGAPVPPQIAG